MHHNRLWYWAGAGVASAAPLAILDPGEMLQFFTALWVIAVGSIAIVVILILLLVRRRKAGARTSGYARSIYGVLIVMAAHVAGLPVGAAIGAAQVGQAKLYCDGLIARLDSIHAATGHYPARLDTLLGDDPDLPLLIERAYTFGPMDDRPGAVFYRADTAGYSLIFPGPSRFAPYDLWRWESNGRLWYYDD